MASKRFMPRMRRRVRVELAGGTPVFTIDVSPGGLCLESMKTAIPGTEVRGKIRVGDKDVEFTGLVAWSTAAEPRLQLRGRFGVRFTSVGPEYFQALLPNKGER